MTTRWNHLQRGIQLSLLLLCALSLTARANQEDYTYTLSQSTNAYTLWTTPPAEKVFKHTIPPSDSGSNIKVYAARNEFEAFQVVVNPKSSGSVTVNIGNFGGNIKSELYLVQTVNITRKSDILGQTGPYPDPLMPKGKGSSIALTGGQNTAFWFSLYIPPSAPPGDYQSQVTIGSLSVPVRLHVFNFTLSDEPHVKSQMNVSHQAFLNKYGVSGTGDAYWMYVNKLKQYFIDHRLTPKSALWSGGLTGSGAAPYIDYNCSTGNFNDTEGVWGFETPAARYLDGTGLMEGKFTHAFNRGKGFPSFMAATFRNNDASQDQRPDTFCGSSRSANDWYTANNPNSPYNVKWFNYLKDMQEYLNTQGYLDKGYYYFANEPQDQADYNAVAWYAQEIKKKAPDLKLMVSEEPKAQIYNHPSYTGAKIDIWLPVMQKFNPAISNARAGAPYHEDTWIYWLHSTRPPYYNPITLDHPGIESKLTGWFLWKYRIRGIAYYSMNNWSQNPWTSPLHDNHNGDLSMLYPPSKNNTPIAYGSNGHRFVPSIRFELMRDSLEDYEYFYIMNGNTQPQPNIVNSADAPVNKIITGLASYTRNSEFMYNLRRLIGLYIGGEIASIPDITPPIEHPRAKGIPKNYYINFQDPYGVPKTSFTQYTYNNGYRYRYLSYAGHNYLQVGTEEYTQKAGFGWLDETTHFLNGRDPWGTEKDERKITYTYDDWAHHPSIFEFDLPNGLYRVKVSVGTPRKVRPNNRVVIEGVTFINNEASSYYITRQKNVLVTDRKLTVDVGIWDKYTMLNYLDIVAVRPSAPKNIAASDGIYSDKVNVTWDGVLGATHYRVYRNSVNNSAGAAALGSWQSNTSFTDNSVTPGTVYYYWVKAAMNSSGGLAGAFSVSDKGAPEDAYEGNDSMATAYDLSSYESTWLSKLNGLGIQTDVDWYEITVPSSAQKLLLSCRFTHQEGNINLALYNASGTLVENATSTTDHEIIYHTLAGSGVYYIRISRSNTGNAYDLWWETDPSESSILWTNSAKGKASLWTINPRSGDRYPDGAIPFPIIPPTPWKATGFESVDETTAYVLWSNREKGKGALWKINPQDGTRYADGAIPFPVVPPVPWTAESFCYLSETLGYVLWSNPEKGKGSLWKINPQDGTRYADGAIPFPIVPPVPWRATSFYYVDDSTAYVLWTNAEKGKAALWKINPQDGTRYADGAIPFPIVPPAPWTAESFYYVSDTVGYVLWTNVDKGKAALWKINPQDGTRYDDGAIPFPIVPPVPWQATSFYYHAAAGAGGLATQQSVSTSRAETAETGDRITLRKRGSGQGTIVLDDLSCGPNCDELEVPYLAGQAQLVTTVAETGSVFRGWQTEQGDALDELHYVQPGEVVYAVFETH